MKKLNTEEIGEKKYKKPVCGNLSQFFLWNLRPTIFLWKQKSKCPQSRGNLCQKLKKKCDLEIFSIFFANIVNI